MLEEVKITDLIAEVAVALGEYPDYRHAADGAPLAVSLEEMVRTILPATLDALIAEHPEWCCDTPADFSAHLRGHTDWGVDDVAVAELPEDFLRLCRIRMNGWGTAVTTDDIGRSSLYSSLGDAAPEWMLKRRRMPTAEIYPGPDSMMMRFRPIVNPTIEEALYYRRPAISDDVLTGVTPQLRTALVEKIAGILSA